jgi:ribosome biogenesis SPOUT family RNA methylase Rps3
MDPARTRYIIIEHMEEWLFEWSYYEYSQMLKYIKPSPNLKLVFTNVECFFTAPPTNAEENTKFVAKFFEDLTSTGLRDRVILIRESMTKLYNADKTSIVLKSTEGESPIEIKMPRTCMLDMRAESTLSCKDNEIFDAYIFGGVLGDHPPRDRCKYLRDDGCTLRQLGKLQLATDTAVLITRIVIDGISEYKDIPILEEPDIEPPKKEDAADVMESVQMEGFSYVSDEFDIETGVITKKSKPQPIMSENIKNNCLFIDFDFGIDIGQMLGEEIAAGGLLF